MTTRCAKKWHIYNKILRTNGEQLKEDVYLKHDTEEDHLDLEQGII